MGRAVSNGKINFLSASAIAKGDPEQYGGCPRRWWYRYVGGKKEPQSKAAALGGQMHNEIENYLKTGKDVLGDIARRAKQFIPKPGDDLIVEHKMYGDELTIDDIPMTGKIDLVHSRPFYIKPDGSQGVLDKHHVEIIDWKSTGSLERVKPPTSRQCIGYGEWACRLLEVPAARVSLVWVPTKRRESAVKTTRLFTRKQLADEWSRAIPIVRTLKVAAQETNPDNVPANEAACEAFGGCPHRQYCSAGQSKTLEQYLGKAGAMSVLDRVLVNSEKDKLIAAEQLVHKAGPSQELRDAWALIESSDYGTPACAGEAHVTVATIKKQPMGGSGLAGSGALGSHTIRTNAEILEIAADIRERAQETAPPPSPAAPPLLPPDVPESNPITPVETPTAVEQTASSSPPAELPPEVPPVGMRKPEKKMKKGELLELAEQYFGDAMKYRKLVDAGPAVIVEVDVARLELYGNCTPGTEAKPLEPYVDLLVQSLCEQYELDGLRLAPNDHPLGYNQWRDVLAAAAVASPPGSGVYTVDLRNEFAAIVFDALRPLCARWAR